ncbi:hypothetical protein P3T18_002924 [Paraburkholderia sp. GAS199]|uniref:hypothetical protein n=1 Tax=Paraburkholderia sp. GAS199 TaxID=3035126 RepID=UPI003D24B905
MFTFIVVVAVAAFVPYVAAPGIEKGVKAVTQPTAEMRYEASPTAAAEGNDAANRILSAQPVSDSSV